MHRKTLATGILLLFLLGMVSPLSMGWNVENTNDQMLLSEYDIAWLDNTDQSTTNEYQSTYLETSSNDRFTAKNQIEPYISQPVGLLVGPMDSAWPMTCYDQANTGRSPYSTLHITGLEKWRFRSGGSNCAPIIDKEGNIYFGDWDRYVISVAPNGTERWRNKMDDMVDTCSPALSEDGVLYVGAWDRKVHALNATTGNHLWATNTGDFIDSSPVIADDGTIYTPNLDGEVWALNPNGTTRWVYDTHGSDIWGDIAIADDGTLYVGTHSGWFHAIYPNGTLRWKYETGERMRGTPSIGDDGTVYVYSWDSYLYAFYPENGTVIWRTSIPYGEETNVAIALDGTLYFGGENLWAVYPNGTIRWVFDPGEHHQIDCSNIAISAEGTLYFGTQINEVDGGDIVAVNPDGTLKWRKRIAYEWVWSSPCIAEDGTVYICSQADVDLGYLHAFGPVSSNSPPETPVISGRVKGHVNTDHWWQFRTYDQDKNPVQFYIDWGDGKEGWVHEHASGEPAIYYHRYAEKGSYTIRAKARDTLGEESDWATYAIRIPYSYPYHPAWQWFQNTFPILSQLLDLLGGLE